MSANIIINLPIDFPQIENHSNLCEDTDTALSFWNNGWSRFRPKSQIHLYNT